MVLGEVLHWIGAPGAVIVAAMVGLGLYHFREVLTLASMAGTYLYILAFVFGVLVLAEVGLIPGVELNVTARFFELLSEAINSFVDGLKAMWRAFA